MLFRSVSQSRYGEAKWEEIKEEASFEEIGFISMKSYDDRITYSLVEAASKLTGRSSSDLLRSFGEYWVLHTSREGYGEMMDSAGNTLVEFLKGLNMMHFRLGKIMPDMIMPHFEVTDEMENSLLLHYKSKRDGFTDMVIGIVKGLSKKFNTECIITIVQSKSEGFNHDIFRIEWK